MEQHHAMHAARSLPWMIMLTWVACTSAEQGPPHHGQALAGPLPNALDRPAPPILLDFDLIQRTCALYVAVRSSALSGSVAFGRDVDEDMIHWNMCPGGTMVACATVPTANGDSLQVGIPWPYPVNNRH